MKTFDVSNVPTAHMAQGMRDYVERGWLPGSFGVAVLENDLSRAAGAADSLNSNRLADWGNWCAWYLPRACWGSREAVAAWAERGGLNGHASIGN